MILLILFIIIFFDFGFRLFKFHYDSINSRKEFADKAEIGVFKFHYDSINSQRHPKIVAFGPQFKFHYDSINSLIGRRLSTKQLHLNSIMILLIHVNKICNALGYKYLNSIMILLIHTCPSIDIIYELKFKFHYDSINSRPKIIPLFKPKNVSILSTSSKFNISFLSLIIYFCNTSYFRRFRLLSIPYIFCTIRGRQKPLIFQVDFVRHILL